jgi:putative Holliday junction resolvase
LNRVLAVDWGARRVGLAVSDPMGLALRSLPTLKVANRRDALEAVAEAALREEADTVLVGLPLNMDGSEGPSAARARALGEGLAGKGFTVRYLDERLTSENAIVRLRERGEARPTRERIDQVAALVLLEDFLAAEQRANRG